MKIYSNIQIKFFYLLALSMWIFPGTTDAQIQYPPQPGAVSFDHLTKPDGTPIEFTDGWTSAGGANPGSINANVSNGSSAFAGSDAITGPWWSTNPNGRGVYDPDEHLLVYKTQDLNVFASQNSSTPPLRGHSSGAPTLILVNGDVSISTTLYANASAPEWLANRWSSPLGGRQGYGPGSPLVDPGSTFTPSHRGDSGSTSTGANPSIALPYGNSRQIPMSQGSATSLSNGAYAVTIICTGNFHMGGSISLRGSNNRTSGGSVRLVSTSMSGQGTIDVRGQTSGDLFVGAGYIRVETYDHIGSNWLGLPTLPGSTKGFVPVVPDNPVAIFPQDIGFPKIRIASINNIPAPLAPNADPISTSNPPSMTIFGQNTVEVICRTDGPIDLDMGVYVKFNAANSWNPAVFGSSNLFVASEITNPPFPDAVDPLIRYWTTGPVLVPDGIGSAIGMVRNVSP